MDKNQYISETRKIVKNYRPNGKKQVTEQLRTLWLCGDIKQSANLIKKNEREKLGFVGISLGVLKPIGKEIGKVAKNRVNDFIPLTRLLWDEYGREGRIVSVMILGQMVLSEPNTIISTCKELVKGSISWEDCDNMGEGIEPIIRKEPENYLEVLSSWLIDDNKWVRRVAIMVIGRLPMKKPEYTEKCLAMILPGVEDIDLDIRRANSFAIRIGARGDKKVVCDFIKENIGGVNYARIWVFSDVIRSMTKKFLPEFKTLLPYYENWLKSIEDSKSKRSLQAAINILKTIPSY